MPSLTRKTIKGRPYYYLRYTQRVNGLSKVVKTTYLGSLQKILPRLLGHQAPPQPQAVEVLDFGQIAALFDVAAQLDLVSLLDHHLPKRDQGLSSGQYLLLAAINRAAAPTSKAQLAHWYQQTVLTRLLPASSAALSSQCFWNHFHDITEAQIEAIERDLAQRLIQRFQLSLRTLVYDGTNFFSYIDTRTPSQLAARGHNKQKRADLRQVSLGMLVSTDFHVPLFHKVYAGNVHDATQFQSITAELRSRYAQLAKHCEHITLIFDKGNNSEEAFGELDLSQFHFVGSLVASQHTELLKIPLRQFRPLRGPGLEEVRAYRTKRTVFGLERTVVVTHNQNLLEGQLQGLTANLTKTRAKLRQLQGRLRRWQKGKIKRGKPPQLASVRAQVEKLLGAQFMKKLLRYQLKGKGIPRLSFQTDAAALERLITTELGKTLLFTDNSDWTDEEIVLGYRAQYHIEHAFRQMKDPHFLGWSPMYHRTDNMIRVHAFYCVLALTLASLLQRTLHQKKLEASIPHLLETLADIKETVVIYPPAARGGKPRTALCLSRQSPEQKRLLAALGLERYRAS
jgi:transposase